MTTVSSLPQLARVECPKDTGEMARDAKCSKCENFGECTRILLNHL